MTPAKVLPETKGFLRDTKGFLVFLEGVKWKHWPEMG